MVGRLRSTFFREKLRSKRTKKNREFIENGEIYKIYKKFFKRVFTNKVLCGKLWEKIKLGQGVYIVRERVSSLCKITKKNYESRVRFAFAEEKRTEVKSGKNRYH